MLALASVMIIAIVSLLITRVATMALSLTGLSKEMARFQARSALSGTGFTTSEAEAVVNHPVRRRITMTLMLIGSAGLVTAVATLMLSFVNADRREALTRLALLIIILVALYAVSRSPWVDRRLSRLIARGLTRFTELEARDYAGLLHIGGDFGVAEVRVNDGDWLAARGLRDLDLRREGVLVLGIERTDGTYEGVPGWDRRIRPGEVVILYGHTARLGELAERRAAPCASEARQPGVPEPRAERGRGQDVADDLTPDTSDLGGRPPRNAFWAQDLTEQHEEFHADDMVEHTDPAASLASTWLSAQVALLADRTRALAIRARGKVGGY